MGKSKKFLLLFSILVFMLLSLSCKDETYVTTNEPTVKLDTVGLQYSDLFDIRYSTGSEFIKSGNDYYFFDYPLEIFSYNFLSQRWSSNFSYNRAEYYSIPRCILNAGDSILMVVPTEFSYPDTCRIYSIDKKTLEVKTLNRKVAILGTLYYSKMYLDRSRLNIFLFKEKKIATIDLNTFRVEYIEKFPIKENYITSWNATIGRREHEIWLYLADQLKIFFMNTDTYESDEVVVPEYLKASTELGLKRGGLVGDLFCIWPRNSNITYSYDIKKKVWLNGGQNPFRNSYYNTSNYINEGGLLYYRNNSKLSVINKK